MKTNDTEDKNGIKGFNPFLDWSFKRLFASEQNKDLLIGFLNLLLEGEEEITELEYINTESIPQNEEERKCIFDVLCRNSKGDQFLVEMQNGRLSYIGNRIIYYTCRLIDKMGKSGQEWMYDLKKVYSVCLMDFSYDIEDPRLRHDIKLCHIGNGKVFSDRINIIMIQLPFSRVGQ